VLHSGGGGDGLDAVADGGEVVFGIGGMSVAAA